MESKPAETDSSWNRGPVAVALLIALVGVSIVGGLVYADVTSSVSRADFRQYSENCEQLDGQSRLVDGGLGRERTELNETHVRECRNTTFAEFRQERYNSMRSTPLNLSQWALYGGAGVSFVAGGLVLLRRELSAG